MAKPAGRPASPPDRSRGAPPAGPPAGAPPDIAAPYAFVPINRHIYLPDWAEQVSMDVPFKCGLSGTLAIEIEAVTPLFIGARKTREGTKQEPNQKSRFTVDGTPEGTPAIPGTSLKGAIRAVLEIASFGKIGPRMDDRKFSIRDLYNPQDYLQYMTDDYRPTAKAGWLRIHQGTGDWLLEPCDYSVARQRDLEAYYQSAFSARIDLGRKQTARDKYQKEWKGRPLDLRFDPDDWRQRDDWAKNRVLSRADNIGHGATPGTVVLTGQPQDRWDKRANRPRKGAKQVDFIFHGRSGAPVTVPESVRDDFESVHRDPNTRTPNDEWGWWRARLIEGGEVPVFWLAADDGTGIRAMGLAMMFRLAYRHSTRAFAAHANSTHSDDTAFDLAETIFGRVGDTPEQSLKGRVRFTLAAQTEPGARGDEREVVAPLLGPKAGFYPAYVTQEEVVAGQPPRVPRRYGEQWTQGYPGYTTYMADGATIRGWKRYPVARAPRPATLPEPYHGQVLTAFTPVGRGARFRGMVHVHNLRPAELGALVWAVTWGFEERLCHALGGAKPFGYGAVRIRLRPEDTELEPNADSGRTLAGEAAIERLRQCVEAFEDKMDDFLEANRVNARWRDTEQIRELLACADLDLGDKAAAAGRLAYLADPQLYQKAKQRDVRAVLPLLTGRRDAGSREVAEPRPGAAARTARPGAHGPAKPKAPEPRRATVDGEDVEILGKTGAKLQVRFVATGDIEWLDPDELD